MWNIGTLEYWIIGIFITVLLGAIGSGLWDSIFKPVVSKVSNIIFTIFSFGAKSTRDNIYKEAAKGHHELPTLYILLIIFLVFPLSMISVEYRLYEKIYGNESNTVQEVYQKCLKKNKKKQCMKNIISYKLHVMTFFSIFLLAIILFRFISINRTNLAITYYQLCLKICSPLLSDTELKGIEQKFSLINSKEDYLDIINQFGELSKSNFFELPKPYYK